MRINKKDMLRRIETADNKIIRLFDKVEKLDKALEELRRANMEKEKARSTKTIKH